MRHSVYRVDRRRQRRMQRQLIERMNGGDGLTQDWNVLTGEVPKFPCNAIGRPKCTSPNRSLETQRAQSNVLHNLMLSLRSLCLRVSKMVGYELPLAE